MRTVLFFIATLLLAAPVMSLNSGARSRVLKLADGTQVAATLQLSTQTDADVFVLVNGLVYSTNRWDAVANNLQQHGATVIRYAFPGQPENLRLLKKGEEPAYFQTGLELSDLVQQLRLILKAAHVTGKIHLVGLSYGATVAAEFSKAYPALVNDTTFIAPLVVPLDSYDPSGLALRSWLQSVRFWEDTPCKLYGAFNPYLCVGQDYWYDTFYKSIYENYLATEIESIPSGVDAATYKKAVFHLVRAARDFDLKEEIKGLHRVSMLVAEKDEANLAADQKLAWANVPKVDRVEFVTFKNAHHALPDEAPEQTAQMLLKIAGE
jgi:pimeloyl-ACP methyl ester carboxylesterase